MPARRLQVQAELGNSVLVPGGECLTLSFKSGRENTRPHNVQILEFPHSTMNATNTMYRGGKVCIYI